MLRLLVAAGVLLSVSLPVSAQYVFGRYDFAAGDSPRAIAAADVDGDGILDLVTGNRSLSVSVLLGNGDGSFQRNVDFPTTIGAGLGAVGAVAAGDFNGDGRLDLAVPNEHVNTVAVLLGNGDGTFRS